MPDAMTEQDAGAAPLPIADFVERAGAIDLAWGHPDPALLPVDELRAAFDRALSRYRADALAYGARTGPGPLIEELAVRLGRIDGRRPAHDELVIVPGASGGLDQATRLLARPGEIVLVEAPTYHFALEIFGNHPVEARGVPFDREGIVVEALAERLRAIRAEGRRVAFLYTIPTFHNPTGVSLTPARRRALIELAEREGLLLVEDDAYRELAYDAPAPASLWSVAPAGRVVRLGSAAKSLAPGLRVGWVTADAAIAARFGGLGHLNSGGNPSHLPGLAVAAFLADGGYDRNLARLVAGHRARRDALLGALGGALPPGATVTRPAGGYFAWVTLAAGDAAALRGPVEAEGSGYVPGRAFVLPAELDRPEAGPVAASASRSFRLSWARWSPADLALSAERLGRGLASGLAAAGGDRRGGGDRPGA